MKNPYEDIQRKKSHTEKDWKQSLSELMKAQNKEDPHKKVFGNSLMTPAEAATDYERQAVQNTLEIGLSEKNEVAIEKLFKGAIIDQGKPVKLTPEMGLNGTEEQRQQAVDYALNKMKQFFDARPRHTPKGGSPMAIEDMTLSHLQNTIKVLILTDDQNKIIGYKGKARYYIEDLRLRGHDVSNYEIGAIFQRRNRFSYRNDSYDAYDMQGDWGGLYGEEAEAGYWNTH